MSTGDKIGSDELTDLIGRVRVSFGGFEDADALIAEAERFAARLAEVEAERDEERSKLETLAHNFDVFVNLYDEACADREAARPVVEAAGAITTSGDMPTTLMWVRLATAVDLYRSATSDHPTGLHGPGGYRSSACIHAVEPGREHLHLECQTNAVRYDGSAKIAAQCKYGNGEDGERCGCLCHLSTTEEKP